MPLKEANVPEHRWYQKRYNARLARDDYSKDWIYPSGLRRIDEAFMRAEGYMVSNHAPKTMADFKNGVYVVDGIQTTFSAAFQHTATSNATMTGGYGDERVTDGDFNDASQWSIGTGASVENGIGNITSTGSGVGISQAGVFEVGKVYEIRVQVEVLSGSIKIESSGGGVAVLLDSTGVYSEQITATRTDLYFNRVSSCNVNILSVSVREAPKVQWRPHNLLTYSEDFSDSNWSKTDTTVTSNAATAPDGTITADKWTNGSTNTSVIQNITVVSGTEYVFAAFAKYIDNQWIKFSFDGSLAWFDIQNGVVGTDNLGTCSITALADGWYMLAGTKTTSDTGFTAGVVLADADGSNTETSGTSAYIWGAHLYRSDLGGMADVPASERVLPALTKYVRTAGRVIGEDLVTNGDFSAHADELVTDGTFDARGDELVTNGTFDTDSDWNKQAGWTISGGTANVDSSVAGSTYLRNGTSVVGKVYEITYEVTSITSGTVRAAAGTQTGSVTATTAGTYTDIVVANNTGGLGVYAVGSTTVASVDNISVREVLADWSLVTGESIALSGDRLLLTNDSTGTNIARAVQALATEIGKTYHFQADSVLGGTAPNAAIAVSNNSDLSGAYGATFVSDGNPLELVFTATATTTYVGVTNYNITADITGLFDNISVKEAVPGWSASNSKISVVDGRARVEISPADGLGYMGQQIAVTPGNVYRCTFNMANPSGPVNNAGVRIGTTQSGNELGQAWLDADATTGEVTFSPSSAETVWITAALSFDADNDYIDFDNIKVEEVDVDPSSARYMARIGHHIFNGQQWVNEGLELESGARTNSLTYSEDLSNAAWTKATNLTLGTPLSIGGISLDLLQNNGATNFMGVTQNGPSVSAGGYVTFSVYVKAGTSSETAMRIQDPTKTDRWTVPLTWTSGVPSFQTGTGTSGWTEVQKTIENIGAGVYRIALTLKNDTAGAYIAACKYYVQWDDAAATVDTYAGGFQAELGPTPSSYTPTSGSTVTRAAETLVQTGDKAPWPTAVYATNDELFASPTLEGSGTVVDTGGGSYDFSWSSGATASLVVPNVLTAGNVYEVTFTISNHISGALAVSLQAFANGGAHNSDGTYTVYVVAASGDDIRFDRSGSTGSFTVSNISVKEITPRALSAVMDGRMTYADTDGNPESKLWRQYADADNYLEVALYTNGAKTGDMAFLQEANGTLDAESTDDNFYSPGINVPFKIASRHLDNAVQGAADGTATTENTTPVGLPDLETTDLAVGYDFMGTIRTFRMFDQDIASTGLVSSTEPSLEPTLSLVFDGSGDSYISFDWSE